MKKNDNNFPYIFSSQFITGSPFVQSDSSVIWSAGNLQGSLFFFPSLHVGRYSDEENVKEK